MALASCFVQLATLVLSFTGEKSFVNVTSPSNVSSMAIQFKTTQSNSQIVAMMSGSESFALNVRNGTLKLEYNFNQIGRGAFDLGTVNTNRWFLVTITSPDNQTTQVRLHESETSITRPCAAKLSRTRNVTLLGWHFSKLLETRGLRIGGPAPASLKPFKGCIGRFSLNNDRDLLNKSKNSQLFKRDIQGALDGCHCGDSPCANGSYLWDRTKGRCDCKCRLGFYGNLCQNQTMTGVSEDDDVEFIYIVAGAVVGVLVVLTLVICIVLYVKRTSSSVFGVYNPKTQEQTQGQQMNTAFTLPVPEKLI